MPYQPKTRRRAAAEQTLTVTGLLGGDRTSAPGLCDPRRSPDLINLMPGPGGGLVRRPGRHTLLNLTGAVHGAYRLVPAGGAAIPLIHAGTALYRLTAAPDGSLSAAAVYAAMADAPSCAVQLGNRLVILDGRTCLCFDGSTAVPAAQIAAVPQVTGGRSPDGTTAGIRRGANLLTGRRTDGFRVPASAAAETVFVLSAGGLSAAAVTARVFRNGWTDPAEGTGFTVNRTAGTVTFSAAPGAAADSGDNVQITYELAVSSAALLNGCRFAALYGAGGRMDRLFLSGSPAAPASDWHTAADDPTDIPAENVFTAGGPGPFVGYSLLRGSLVTHRREAPDGRNLFFRTGTETAGGAQDFAVTEEAAGGSAVCRRSFAVLGGEPFYLTDGGVEALAAASAGGWTSRPRCRLLGSGPDGDPAARCCAVWNGFYVLAAGEDLYLLNGRQRSGADGPGGDAQLEFYRWTGAAASALWCWDGTLYCGTAGGAVRAFYGDVRAAHANDDGSPITVRWTLPLQPNGVPGSRRTVTDLRFLVLPGAGMSGRLRLLTGLTREAFAENFSLTPSPADGSPAVLTAAGRLRRTAFLAAQIESSSLGGDFGLLGYALRSRTAGKLRAETKNETAKGTEGSL